MSHLELSSARSTGVDAGDLQHRLVLPVAVLAPVIMPPLFLEDDDLVGAAMLDQGGADRGARDQRRAGRHLGAVADHQHFVQLDRRTRLAGELFDRDHVVGGDLVLLAAGADHCEHLEPPLSWRLVCRRENTTDGPRPSGSGEYNDRSFCVNRNPGAVAAMNDAAPPANPQEFYDTGRFGVVRVVARACPLCGGENAAPRPGYGDSIWRLCECRACG